jgi:ABC-type nitrate/sulfonate/bicarbonate transport system substrate-binding protein
VGRVLVILRRSGVSSKLAAVFIVILVAAVGGGYLLYQGSFSQENPVSINLGFPPGPEHAPQYYSLQQGYYSSQGLNASLIPGTGSLAAISAVSAGRVDFAIIDASGLVFSLVSSNITNVKIVAILFPASFYGILYNKAFVSSVSDLASTPGALNNPSTSEETRLFLALAKQNNINVTGNAQYVTSSTIMDGLLTTGKVAWIEGGAQDVAFLQPAATQVGVQLGFIPFAQLGFSSYGEVLITSTSMISAHSDLVGKVVSATMKGMVQSALNPAAAAAAENHYEPQLNLTSMLQGFNLDISCCLQGITQSTNPLVYGYITPAAMTNTVNFALAASGITESVDPTEFYTNQFTTAP